MDRIANRVEISAHNAIPRAMYVVSALLPIAKSRNAAKTIHQFNIISLGCFIPLCFPFLSVRSGPVGALSVTEPGEDASTIATMTTLAQDGTSAHLPGATRICQPNCPA